MEAAMDSVIEKKIQGLREESAEARRKIRLLRKIAAGVDEGALERIAGVTVYSGYDFSLLGSPPVYRVNFQPKSPKGNRQLRRAIARVCGGAKKEKSDGLLVLRGRTKYGRTPVVVTLEGDVPESCKVIEKQVWVPERYIPGHMEPGRYETRKEVVCGKAAKAAGQAEPKVGGAE